MRKFKLFSYLLIAGMLFSNANMYAMEGQNPNLGNEENRHDGRDIVVFADLTVDETFKKLFENKDVSMAFLRKILEEDLRELNCDIVDLEPIRTKSTDDTYSLDGHHSRRSTDFDVYWRCKCKSIDALLPEADRVFYIDVEMQNDCQEFYIERVGYYASKIISQQTPTYGAPYDGVAPVFVLSFLNFVYDDSLGTIFDTSICFKSRTDPNVTVPFRSNGQAKMTFIQIPKFESRFPTQAVDIVEYLSLIMKLSKTNIGPDSKKICIGRDKLENNSFDANICNSIIDTLVDFAKTEAYRSAVEQDSIYHANLTKFYNQGKQEGAMIEGKKRTVAELENYHKLGVLDNAVPMLIEQNSNNPEILALIDETVKRIKSHSTK